MQSVKQELYITYRWISLAIGVILLLGSIARFTLPDSGLPNITYMTGVFSVILIMYALFVYKRVATKTSHWEAMLIQVIIQAMTIFTLVQTTGKMGSYFMILWAILCLTGGMFGIYGSAGETLISVIYFVAASTDMNGTPHYAGQDVIILCGLVLAAVVGQLFWRRQYINGESAKINALSGELKTSQRQAELLVQSLTDGVLLIDNDNSITLMNPAAALLTEWTIEEGSGTDHRLVLKLNAENGAELEQKDNPLTELLHRTAASVETYQLTGQKGRQTVVSVVTSPVIDPKTSVIVGAIIVLRDISATHKSDKQRADFISTASHEMRTPVAAIEGYLQLALNEKVSKIDPKARQYLEKALDSTHHLGQLFQDLLASAKAEDGRIVSHPVAVEMGEYIEGLAETFKFSAEKRGLLTEFILGKASGPGGEHVVRPLYYVHADPDRLREVVTNLFDNAVKYTPSGRITVGLTGNDNVVQLFIRDTGPGIPAEDVPHLFQKFYRVDNSSTRTVGGTGLGLFISKKIIELYNGRIWAESTVGTGSTFYINLPRITSSRADELKRQALQSSGSVPINSLTTPV